MDNVQGENAAVETKKNGPTAAYSQSAGQKDAKNRMANKLRKKRAHKRNLRRPNTNG